ncbi:MAG TPA: hypothetical protein VFQ39_04205 [Longimicrobium sp.]|nr:hypothetical protein [Longimicrobium sp.]
MSARGPVQRPNALTLPVLGIETRFESNSAEVLSMAEEVFGAWRTAEGDPRVDTRMAHVRIEVVPDAEMGDASGPVRHAGTAHRLAVTSSACDGVAEAATRTAHARVAESLVADRARFRAEVLDALTIALLVRLDRQPLHAAAVVDGDRALLLSGLSGVGKSTLTYAALRAGLKVMSEEIVFLQGDPVPRVWGMPSTINLLPDAHAFFPELTRITPTRLPNGDVKRIVSVRDMGGVPDAPVTERAGVCLLARGEGGPRAERIPAEEAVEGLTAQLEPGFHFFAEMIGARVRPFAERGAWRLILPPHPADALPALREMLEQL